MTWPAGVIAPTLIHTQPSTGVYVDDTGVYYGPYTLSNNDTSNQTITNTPNSGSLTINKLDAKTDAKLTGATFTVSVDTTDWSEELIGLLPNGFAKVGETDTYAMTTGATNANGQVKVDNLPIYNGDAPIEYTVTEAAAPENYLVDDEPQTTKLALNGTAYTASLTFNDPPMAKVVVTKTWYSQWSRTATTRSTTRLPAPRSPSLKRSMASSFRSAERSPPLRTAPPPSRVWTAPRPTTSLS